MFQSMRLRSKGDKESKDGERKTDLELDSNVVAKEPKDNSREEVTVSAIDTISFGYNLFNQSVLQRVAPAAPSTYERILSYENVASPIEPGFGNNQYASMR